MLVTPSLNIKESPCALRTGCSTGTSLGMLALAPRPRSPRTTSHRRLPGLYRRPGSPATPPPSRRATSRADRAMHRRGLRDHRGMHRRAVECRHAAAAEPATERLSRRRSRRRGRRRRARRLRAPGRCRARPPPSTACCRAEAQAAADARPPQTLRPRPSAGRRDAQAAARHRLLLMRRRCRRAAAARRSRAAAAQAAADAQAADAPAAQAAASPAAAQPQQPRQLPQQPAQPLMPPWPSSQGRAQRRARPVPVGARPGRRGDFANAQPLAEPPRAHPRALHRTRAIPSIEACIGQSLPPLPQPPPAEQPHR